ncbi:MAG: NINE protein [Sphingobacteriaceae bacterium]|nr:NINE protein [Sphingobacteriaceae bacterium]
MKTFLDSHFIKFFIFSILALGVTAVNANNNNLTFVDTLYLYTDTVQMEVFISNIDQNKDAQRPFPILHFIKEKRKKNKKVIATILAFPLPFGIVGLHRIYLGTAPYVPVVYVASLGGVLGILPFIDFCVLLLDKEIDRYQNNKQVFMWVNE